MSHYPLPKNSKSSSEILSTMKYLKEKDVHHNKGKAFCLVFNGGDEVKEIMKEASNMFISDNGLNPTAFPSLKQFENEIVQMTASFFNPPTTVAGTMTSGGTESILMAVKAAREWGRKEKGITNPELIMPITAHPAFNKACHYFKIKLITVDVDPETFKADINQIKKKISRNTIMLVGSAANYTQGVVDPIEEIADLALKHNILCHVDACIGGIILSCWNKLGYEVPKFDFDIPGVTSISVDLHKYGFCPKGSSVVLYRTPKLRKYQFFATTTWPGGLYISPSFMGTRPGGPIAGSWAVMQHLGEEGYLKLATQAKQATDEFITRINNTKGVYLLTKPDMSIISFGSKEYDIFAIADELSFKGWYMDRQQEPESIHLTIMPQHLSIIGDFFKDLNSAIEKSKHTRPNKDRFMNRLTKGIVKMVPDFLISKMAKKETAKLDFASDGKQRMAPMYGMMGNLTGKGTLDEICVDVMDKIFTYAPRAEEKTDQEKKINDSMLN